MSLATLCPPKCILPSRQDSEKRDPKNVFFTKALFHRKKRNKKKVFLSQRLLKLSLIQPSRISVWTIWNRPFARPVTKVCFSSLILSAVICRKKRERK